MDGYDETQRGGWHLVIVLVGLLKTAFGLLNITVPEWLPQANSALVGCGIVMLLASALAVYMRVWEEGDRLAVRFDPISLLDTRIAHAGMESVQLCRLSGLYGRGVHGIPWHSIAFDSWGSDAVRTRLNERRGLQRAHTYLIGSEEPDAQAAFLQGKPEEAP